MKLEIGLLLEFRNKPEYRRAMIIGKSSETSTLLWVDSREAERFDEATLQTLLADHRVVVLRLEKEHSEILYKDRSTKEQEEIWFRYEVVMALSRAGIRTVTGLAETESVIQQAAETAGRKAPHWQTVRQWHTRWMIGGYLIHALAPRTRFQGNRKSRLHPKVTSLMQEAFWEINSGEWKDMRTGFESLEEQIRTHNRELEAAVAAGVADKNATPLTCPSYMTFTTFCNDQTFEIKEIARSGFRSYEIRHGAVARATPALHALEFVEIDTTPLNIYVLTDSDGDVVYRPLLTLLLDRYSDIVLGFHITFDPPSAETVLATMRGAFSPKAELCGRYETTKEWPAHGLPQTLVFDNGKEYWSTSVTEAMAELGINVQYCPIRTPQFKGSIERFFKTIKTRVLQKLKGYVRTDNDGHDTCKPSREATLTIEELRRELTRWIVDVHHNSVSRNDIDTPLEKWDESIRRVPIRQITAEQRLYGLLHATPCALTSKGIELHNLYYKSDELDALRRRRTTEKSVGVVVRSNPIDMMFVYVKDDFNQTYLKVPCAEPDRVRGVTLELQKRRNAAANATRNRKNNAKELIDAKDRQVRSARETSKRKPNTKVKRDRYKARAREAEQRYEEYYGEDSVLVDHSVPTELTHDVIEAADEWSVE